MASSGSFTFLIECWQSRLSPVSSSLIPLPAAIPHKNLITVSLHSQSILPPLESIFGGFISTTPFFIFTFAPNFFIHEIAARDSLFRHGLITYVFPFAMQPSINAL